MTTPLPSWFSNSINELRRVDDITSLTLSLFPLDRSLRIEK